MPAVLDRLQSLRVADVMNSHVVPLFSHQTMSEAATVFLEHHISGAPVIDEQGRCIGILSAADFVAHEREQSAEATSISPTGKAVAGQSPFSRVAAHMTPTVQTVAAKTSLVEAGRIMCAHHVHRLPVLDEGGYPRGMITSLDIVAAVVQAVEEQRGPQ